MQHAAEPTLKRHVPLLIDHMDSHFAQLRQEGVHHTQMLEELRQRSAEHERASARIGEQLSRWTLELQRPRVIPIPGLLQSVDDFAASMRTLNPTPASLPADTQQAAHPLPDTQPSSLVQEEQSAVVLTNYSFLPDFKMDKTLKTVEELWREYTVGLGGQPSMRRAYETGKPGVAESKRLGTTVLRRTKTAS